MAEENDDIFRPQPDLGYRELAPECSIEEFEKVVRSRRSVRVFKPEPIPAEVVQKCLELALLAPNSSNLQPWEFYWVKNPQMREKVNQACLGQPAATTAAEIIIAVARTESWKKHRRQMLGVFAQAETQGQRVPRGAWNYYQKICLYAYTVGPFSILAPLKWVVRSLLRLTRPLPDLPLTRKDLVLWSSKTTALACENLMLAFRAYGYDTCPMEGLDPSRIKRILKLPKDAEIVMGISAGKRADNGIYGPQLRFDSQQFLFKI